MCLINATFYRFVRIGFTFKAKPCSEGTIYNYTVSALFQTTILQTVETGAKLTLIYSSNLQNFRHNNHMQFTLYPPTAKHYLLSILEKSKNTCGLLLHGIN